MVCLSRHVIYAPCQSESTLDSRVFLLRNSNTPGASPLQWPSLGVSMPLMLSDRTCAYHGSGPTGHVSRRNLHSSLFVSTKINIETSGKCHPCRFSLRECWIWSRARPFVLRLRCCQRPMTETCPVAFISYGGGLTVSGSVSGPEECVRVPFSTQ